MAAHLHLGFTDIELIYSKTRTSRQQFLDEMDPVIPWDACLALIETVYYKILVALPLSIFPDGSIPDAFTMLMNYDLWGITVSAAYSLWV